MEVTIRPKNFKLPTDIESHIRKRIQRLPRHLDNIESAEVILSQQPTHLTPQRFQYVAQITLHTRTNIIRSEVSGPELLTTIDQTADRLQRQMERYKGRHFRRHKGVAGLGRSSVDTPPVDAPSIVEMASPALPAEKPNASIRHVNLSSHDGAADDDEEAGAIVKVKRFNVQPMFPEEAIEQMELLGHDFFVFWNANEESMNVLYRRKEGDYGLLQPDLS